MPQNSSHPSVRASTPTSCWNPIGLISLPLSLPPSLPHSHLPRCRRVQWAFKRQETMPSISVRSCWLLIFCADIQYLSNWPISRQEISVILKKNKKKVQSPAGDRVKVVNVVFSPRGLAMMGASKERRELSSCWKPRSGSLTPVM